MNDTATATTGFTFIPHWKLDPNPENDEAVQAFWKSEGALANDAQAKERLKEIVMHARDASGAVAGVCTAVPLTHPRLGQPMYYYRCFIGKQWRKSRLVFVMLKRAQRLLEEYAQANAYPCIGILLELENQRFDEKGRMPVWPWSGFIYVGKSQRNLELRLYYFRGARLKKMKT